MAEDPERRRARTRAWFKRRYASDPEFRERVRANGRKHYHKYRSKILKKNRGKPAKRTPEGYAAHVKRATIWTRKKRASDPEYRARERLRTNERLKERRQLDPAAARARDTASRHKRNPGIPIRAIASAIADGRINLLEAVAQIRRIVDQVDGEVAKFGRLSE